MIDPITAVATATSAFNLIKKGFQAGRDIEGMAGDLGRWMGAVSDIKKAEEYSKKPPLFKKLFLQHEYCLSLCQVSNDAQMQNE